jgi:hypothetical protein
MARGATQWREERLNFAKRDTMARGASQFREARHNGAAQWREERLNFVKRDTVARGATRGKWGDCWKMARVARKYGFHGVHQKCQVCYMIKIVNKTYSIGSTRGSTSIRQYRSRNAQFSFKFESLLIELDKKYDITVYYLHWSSMRPRM